MIIMCQETNPYRYKKCILQQKITQHIYIIMFSNILHRTIMKFNRFSLFHKI